MIFPDKLLKQIPETTYLTTDNTYRYRVIIRIMFHHYESSIELKITPYLFKMA